MQALKYLDGIDAELRFTIRGLATSEKRTWAYRGGITHYTFLENSDFIEEIVEAVPNKTPLHLVPSACDFPAVDSILYDPVRCVNKSTGQPVNVSTCQQSLRKRVFLPPKRVEYMTYIS